MKNLNHFYFAVCIKPFGIKIGAFYVCKEHNHYINNKSRYFAKKFNIKLEYIEIVRISENYYNDNYWWLNANK